MSELRRSFFTEEHMWVFIDGFMDDVLTGTLENEPLLMMPLKWGDRVEVRLNEEGRIKRNQRKTNDEV
jgi:hypothetical protein